MRGAMFKPTRALPLMTCAAISLLAALIELFVSGQIYSFLKSPEITDHVLRGVFDYWSPISEVARSVLMVSNGVLLILTIAWLWRVVANAASLDKDHFKTKPSFALWGSLMPILNVFYPFYLLRKVWLSADPSSNVLATILVVGLWIADFVMVLARLIWLLVTVNYVDAGVADREKLALVYTGEYLTQASFLVAGVLTIVIISKLNRAQSRKALATGVTSVALKADLVTFSGLAAVLLAQIGMPLLGLIATIMIYGFIWRQFGLLGSIAAVVFVPFTVTLVPWYAGFAKQDWSLVFVSYFAGIMLFLILHLGVWLSDAND